MRATYYKGTLSVETDLGKFKEEIKSKEDLSHTSFDTVIPDIKIQCNRLSDSNFVATLLYHEYEGDIIIFTTCDIMILGE